MLAGVIQAKDLLLTLHVGESLCAYHVGVDIIEHMFYNKRLRGGVGEFSKPQLITQPVHGGVHNTSSAGRFHNWPPSTS